METERSRLSSRAIGVEKQEIQDEGRAARQGRRGGGAASWGPAAHSAHGRHVDLDRSRGGQ